MVVLHDEQEGANPVSQSDQRESVESAGAGEKNVTLSLILSYMGFLPDWKYHDVFSRAPGVAQENEGE